MEVGGGQVPQKAAVGRGLGVGGVFLLNGLGT